MNKKYSYYQVDKFLFEIITLNDQYVISLKVVNSKKEVNQKFDLSDLVFKQLCEYFDRQRKSFDFPIKLIGTDFQIKVWNALLKIPYGKTKSYQQIAKDIGCEKAYRAIGNANNKNPIIIAIPCHRVIKNNNQIGGYALGDNVKKYLLDLEQN